MWLRMPENIFRTCSLLLSHSSIFLLFPPVSLLPLTMTNLLKMLTSPNLNLEVYPSASLGNTRSATAIEVTGWNVWEEFNYDNITSIYKDDLAILCDKPTPAHLSSYDLEIWNEDCLHDVLRADNMRLVNLALQLACARRRIHVPHLGRGSRCGNYDWALVCYSNRDEWDRYANIMPGDTKLNNKWHPDLIISNFKEWKLPVSQISGYMTDTGVRYGFLISDAYLVVFRISISPTGPGLASTRQPRPREQFTSSPDISGISSMEDSMTNLAVNDSTFEADELEGEYNNPEYRAIPWSNYGKGGLTVNLGLWALAMMAHTSDYKISTEYPPLNNWTKTHKGYVNNTSGRTEKKLPKGAVLIREEGNTPRTEGSAPGSRGEQPAPGPSVSSRSGPSRSSRNSRLASTPSESSRGERDAVAERSCIEVAAGLSSRDESIGYASAEKTRYLDITKNMERTGHHRYKFNTVPGEKVKTSRNDWQDDPRGMGWLYVYKDEIYLTRKFP